MKQAIPKYRKRLSQGEMTSPLFFIGDQLRYLAIITAIPLIFGLLFIIVPVNRWRVIRDFRIRDPIFLTIGTFLIYGALRLAMIFRILL